MKICNLFSSMIFLTSVFCFGVFPSFVGWIVPLGSFFFMIALIPKIKYKGFLHWFPWMFLVLILGFLSPYDEAIHRALIIATPICVGMIASSFKWKDSDIDWIIKLVNVSAFIFICIGIRDAISFGLGSLYGNQASAQTAVALIWLLVIRYKIFGNIKNVSLAVVLEILLILTVMRTCIFTGLLSLNVLLKEKLFSLKNILLLIVVLILLAGLVSVPAISNKFFNKPISLNELPNRLDSLNSNGRFHMWALLVNGIREYPFFGHGANASEDFLFRISKDFAHPHNEFLRILFDYGFFGMALFSYGFYRQVRRLYYLSGLLDEKRKKFIVQSALWLFVPYFTLMTTDNILLYAAFILNIHFLFIGIAESFVPDLYKVEKIIPVHIQKASG